MKVSELFEALPPLNFGTTKSVQKNPSKHPKWTFAEIADKYDLTKGDLTGAMRKFGFPEKSLKKSSGSNSGAATYYDSVEVTKWYKKVLKLVGGDPKDFAKNIKAYKPEKD